MQTFLPHDSFYASVVCLDYRRLGKQRVEGMQIINTLEGRSTGWKNHPAVKMWEGHVGALKLYTNLCITEWENRGYNNNMIKYDLTREELAYPKWVGIHEFHASHRSNLLRKDFEHYSQFGWTESPDLPYWWPYS